MAFSDDCTDIATFLGAIMALGAGHEGARIAARAISMAVFDAHTKGHLPMASPLHPGVPSAGPGGRRRLFSAAPAADMGD